MWHAVRWYDDRLICRTRRWIDILFQQEEFVLAVTGITGAVLRRVSLHVVRCGVFPRGHVVELRQQVVAVEREQVGICGSMAEHHPVPRAIFAFKRIQPDLERHLRRFGAEKFNALAIDTGMATETTLVRSGGMAGLASHLVQMGIVMLFDLIACLANVFVTILAGWALRAIVARAVAAIMITA